MPPSDPRSLLVVGAGLAGWRTAKETRKAGFDGTITVLSDEDEIPYRKVTIQGHIQVLYQPGRDRLWQHLYRAIASRYISVEEANA